MKRLQRLVHAPRSQGSGGVKTVQRNEQGSAAVGFLFTSLLLTMVLMGLLQLVMVMHTRVLLIDIAGRPPGWAGAMVLTLPTVLPMHNRC